MIEDQHTKNEWSKWRCGSVDILLHSTDSAAAKYPANVA
jgi:hypothetical protein